ncbi:MAG: helix-turn-helix domain-containing protein, partial [Ktedonobacterales bacterium]|nr:helix-turn-helix domain-containing protein [Ktedonobacterales bacterium]
MAEPNFERFRDTLRAHRLAKGLSQDQLGRKVGLSAREISNLERGVRGVPYEDTLIKMARALGLKGDKRAEFMKLAKLTRQSREADAPRQAAAPPHVPPRRTLVRAVMERIVAWGTPPKRMLLAGSLIAIAGLSLAVIIQVWAVGAANYESIIPNTTDETFCPGASALCQTAEGSVRGSVHMVCWQDAIWID